MPKPARIPSQTQYEKIYWDLYLIDLANFFQNQKKEIRKIIHKNEWWFSITDIIEVLTGTERPRKYWNDLKKKLIKEGYSEVSENIGQLE